MNVAQVACLTWELLQLATNPLGVYIPLPMT